MSEPQGRHERRSRESEKRERASGAVAAVIGVTCVAIATGQLHGPFAILLFIFGSLLSAGGLAALLARVRQIGALLGRWFGPSFRWTRQRWRWATAFTVVALMVATAVWWLIARQEPACVAPFELRIAATAEIVPVIEMLGSTFEQTEQLTPEGCLRVHVRVYSVPSAGVAYRAFVAGWPDERGGVPGQEDNNPVRDVGPEPDVWVAGSSAEVGRVQDTLRQDNRTDPTFLYSNAQGQVRSVARTDVVLALPDRQARAYGWPDPSLAWNDVRRDILRGRLRLRRANPSTSTTAALGTAALYLASGGRLDSARPDVSALAHDLERQIAPSGDDTSSVLCELRQLAQRGKPLPAVLLPAKAVIDYSQGRGLSPDCDVPDGKPAPLRAFFLPTTPHLDYPCVVISSSTWSSLNGAPPEGARPYETVRQSWAERLCSFLANAKNGQFMRAYGFRDNLGVTPSNDTEGALGHSGVYQPRPTASQLTTAIDLWTGAKRPARVLQVLDVSGSMTTTFSGLGGTRLSAATDAARQTLKQMSPEDQFGLWSFSTELDRGRDYRQLVPVGRMSEPVGGTSRRQRAERALAELRPANDTGLYDTIFDALEAMEPGSGPNMVNAVVVLTDGANDDRHQTHSLSDVHELTKRSRAELMVIALGEASCGPNSELLTLTQDSDGLCLDAGRSNQIDRAFDQVKARLWGTAT
jgi:Ca-activated chloride channel homolog